MLITSAGSAAAYTSLNGFAELSYTKYTSDVGKARFTGDSFAQTYSLTYTTSNLLHKAQPRYYDLRVGYDWLSFDTNTSTNTNSTSINKVFGKLRYDGKVGYNPAGQPFTFTAYATDSNPVYFKETPGEISLISNNLIYAIEGQYKSEMYGASLTFDPARANTSTLRGLPWMHLDYNEMFMKSLGSYYKQDYKITNISAATLSKGSNWLQFRSSDYVDNLESRNNYSQKEFQIGLVDNRGQRLWAALTNWINVSADGQLTIRSGASQSDVYDLNLMAVASRRTWQARTFMNYNRSMETADGRVLNQESIARIPFFVKGVYGSDTNWFGSVSFLRGQQVRDLRTGDSYSNSVSVGATTFNRASFTLTPILSVSNSRGYYDTVDRLNLRASLETNSTARFSRKTGIAASTYFDYTDDGYDTETSKTWKQHFALKTTYRPESRYMYSLKNDTEIGDGRGPFTAVSGANSNQSYFTSRTEAEFSWIPTAALLNTLTAYYDFRTADGSDDLQELTLIHRITFDKQKTFYRLDTTYTQIKRGADSSWAFYNSGDFQYLPDRYTDASLRYTYTKLGGNAATGGNGTIYDTQSLELRERYNYNFYSRAGVIRKLATLSQEFNISGYEKLNEKRYTYYAQVSGSYSPTQRLSLYGSAKYENNDIGKETFYYGAGLGADFRLLSTSLDYAKAKRPSDDRVEERFSASVRRVF